ncbi:hypothetical protein [Lactiplantibacillus plantarum]|uniref:hypothetical protein n=1 Tax=Lactiplantibacillus plantarum TaxID=1590 RepID=UPI001BA63243|nr:hypothetical protein [Lactiplantibacillus plantarum]MBS0935689.1 hypothetical protein [Lactiplantibacillus plantarum]MBS0943954.1 hypothetical protein [Lactiplantibacillus plantarum]MBS0955457.1 hypothetical protein [Lactiplantibacillus plantarum]
MGLIKKNADNLNVQVEKKVNTTRNLNTNITKAKDRKSLRVNTSTYNTIRSISYIREEKMYAILDEMVEDYKKTKLSPREREIFDNMTEK